MKKLLILILIALLVLLGYFIIIQGVGTEGSLQILGIKGIKGIQAKNAELEQKIQEATSLAEKDYQSVLSEIKQNTQSFEDAKKRYEDNVIINEGGEVETLSKPYDIETLWVRLGNHATSQGANIQEMKVNNSTTGAEGTYDLDFTVTGSYICITDFISAIENDSTLGFKIEDFNMRPSGSELQATFTCKDISINKDELNENVVVTTTDNTTGNTTSNTNTTGNTTSNTNTINTVQ